MAVRCDLASKQQKCTLKRTNGISLSKFTLKSCSECRQVLPQVADDMPSPFYLLFMLWLVSQLLGFPSA